ncbi:MAG: hypothetical protein ABL921_06345 [Pirellula sp.]
MPFYKSIWSASIRLLILGLGWLAVSTPSALANQWAPSVGEAKEVQFRTHDISTRVNRTFPYSPVAHAALHLDNTASQLVESVKCGAAWHQVQDALHRTCSMAGQVNSLINEDCDVRNDRRIRDYMLDLSKRVERLRCSLDKDYARTQPKFCPPAVHPHTSLRHSRTEFVVPNCSVPSTVHPYPNSTYDFDSLPQGYRHPADFALPYGREQYRPAPLGIRPSESTPFESRPFQSQPNDYRPNGFEGGPEALPTGTQIGPINYRVENGSPRNGQRAVAIAQIGLEVLRMLGN